MSLNDIKMPPQLVAGLYSDTLVETKLEGIFEIETSKETIADIEADVIEQMVQQVAEQTEVAVKQPVDIQQVNEQPVIGPKMSEEKVDEPSQIVSSIKELSIEKESESSQQFNFQGNNNKRILILSFNEKAQYLPDQELKFLVSVLKACALTLEDVAILNLKRQPAEYSKLHSFFQSKVALLFGVEPQDIDLPMNFPQFQLQNFNNCVYLHVPTLSEIEKAKELKMKLWGCLKQLFSL